MFKLLKRTIADFNSMTPQQLVSQLDQYIIGQADAKKSVANALRNRWRRQHIQGEIKDEVTPKNILMIGPTGCGKTEIARRLAKLTNAPFIKVEATKYTEVGYHGQDVDNIVKDLSATGTKLIQNKIQETVNSFDYSQILDKWILDLMLGPSDSFRREEMEKQLKAGDLNERQVECVFPDTQQILKGETINDFIQCLLNWSPGKSISDNKETMKVSQAKEQLQSHIKEGIMQQYDIQKECIQSIQSHGIVFIDEIDKIALPQDSLRYAGNPSAEGVQRDLLPILEGTTVNTKHGSINTEQILFIAAGAFSDVEVNDLLPELLGRLPIRVYLQPLTSKQLLQILTTPKNSLVKQHQALLKTEEIDLQFENEALEAIAQLADQLNATQENLGARRLHTIMERVIGDISFNASDYKGKTVIITKEMVYEKCKEMQEKGNLRKYVM